MTIYAGICANCGADKALHHYETDQCPKDGIEEPSLEKPQQWDSTTFEDAGVKKLNDAAPDLLAACRMAYEEMQFGGDWENAKRVLKEAIEKATGIVK